MQVLNGLLQFFRNDRNPINEKRQKIENIPQGVTLSDLCGYVNTLYEVFDLSFLKFTETTDESFALTAIDTLLVIQHLEQMKEHLPLPICKRNWKNNQILH